MKAEAADVNMVPPRRSEPDPGRDVFLWRTEEFTLETFFFLGNWFIVRGLWVSQAAQG